MIRVFARKTSMTPTDDLAFYDEPPLFKLPENMPVMVSVTFTWDKQRGIQLFRSWRDCGRWEDVRMGGPAWDSPAYEFDPGQFVKEGVTITSRGCPKKCSFCLVSKREGKLKELEIKPGYIIQDNNLLACSQGHILEVFDMLASQRKGAEFKGGLDIDYLKPWHVELMKRIKINELWMACDSNIGLIRLEKAVDLLADFSINKKHCYVLIGNTDITEAENRLETVYEMGFLPFAQLYQGITPKTYPKDWRDLARKWSRPAAYRNVNNERNRQMAGLTKPKE